jgi:hypothetical protein
MLVAPIQKRLRDRRASAATADTRRGSENDDEPEGQRVVQPTNERSAAAFTSILWQVCAALAKSWLTWVVVMVAVLVGVSLVSAYITNSKIQLESLLHCHVCKYAAY